MKSWMKLLFIATALNMPLVSMAYFEDSYHEEDSYQNDRVERSYEEDSRSRPSYWERKEIQRERREAFRPRVKESKVETVLVEDVSSSKKVNVYTSPAELMFGSYQIGADFRLTRKTTLGVNASFLNSTFEDSESGHELDLFGQSVGLRYNLFFNGAFTDSFLLQTEIGAMRVDFTDLTKVRNGDVSGITKAAGLYGHLGVGYGWFWKKLNVQVLGGAKYISKDFANGKGKWFLPGKGISPWVGLNLGLSL